jgi:hypothetical protein
VIEACRLAGRVVENALHGAPDPTADPAVQQRRLELVQEAGETLAAIRDLAGPDLPDPLIDPDTLAEAVRRGILDAPQLRNNPYARGQVMTHIIAGACRAVDSSGRPLSEKERLAALEEE